MRESITTHDGRSEYRRRRVMSDVGTHPPLFLERATARVALVYVENPPRAKGVLS